MTDSQRKDGAFERPKENEWVQPVRKEYQMRCCDCGLVHAMDFRIFRGRVQFRVRRNDAATEYMREVEMKR